MLFTRCPDCGTTFRVTDDALTKANGQVRCGRCASVFNAYAEQRDAPSDLVQPPASEPATPEHTTSGAAGAGERETAAGAARVPQAATMRTAAPAPRGPAGATAQSASPQPRSQPPHETPPESAPTTPAVPAAREPQREASRDAPRAAPAADPSAVAKTTGPPGVVTSDEQGNAAIALDGELGSMSVADVVAEVALGSTAYASAADLDTALAYSDEPITPSQVEEVLATDDLSVWLLEQEGSRERNGWWGIGTIVAMLALALQGIHHYRGHLVNATLIGPVVKSAYAALGVDVIPHWDIRQYEILDWVATAEPNTRGQGSLKITAHIKNRGPEQQPYPSVHLELKDRWEAAVGSRIFAPHEYLAVTPQSLMAPGETTRAEIEVVDPGPDAYGFELDVCIEVETHQLSCGSDKVFL